jgi:hypothetical protein
MFTRIAVRSVYAVLLLAGAVRAGAVMPQSAARVADYSISARLDPEKKELTGRERLAWRNPSRDSVSELWFHLYLNAFRNNRSTFNIESGGQLRGDYIPEDGWGWTDVTELKLADGTDLLPAMTFEHPDDDNADDRTVSRVVLPRPVPPGGEVELDIAWTASLPKVYARTGYFEDFYAVAQWFPKIAVYEPAGLRGRTSGGWNAHQFHANSEFYADYGTYHVEITLPSSYVVGATGPRISRKENGDGTTTYVHEQADIHDFAWSADPNFLEFVETFDAETEVSAAEITRTARLLDRPEAEIRLRDVEIRLLLQPSHLPQKERHFRATRLALKWFGLWYGAYPYPTITVIDPPADAGGATGVEYPTLFFAGTNYAANFWPVAGIHEAEIVTVHEFGHQFWYGLVGSNEFEEAWLDEGFNTYSTARVLDLGYGGAESKTLSFLGVGISAADLDRLGNHENRRFDSIATPSWRFSRNNYSFNSYPRTALMLETLGATLGEQTMARVMRTYHERFRFGHPCGADFFAVAEEVSGRDLDGFFDQVVEGSGVFDPAISRLTSEKVKPFLGRDESKPSPAIVTEKAARAAEGEPVTGDAALYRSEIELKQLGEVRLPVEVELRFEGGAVERRVWNGDRRWERWTIERKERLVEAVIDPDDVLRLDANRLNNGMRSRKDRAVPHLWGATALFWVARGLAWMGL